MTRDYDSVFLGGKNGPLATGRLKVAEAGIGWKNAISGQIVTISATDIHKVSWQRVCKEYQLKIVKKDGSAVEFDGFNKEAYDDLAGAIKVYYQMTLEQKEAALRGWNWGQVEFQGSNLAFSVANKPAFEVPLTEVANTSLASKTEVMIEFAPPEVKGPDGRALKIKEDLLVEMRFFVPGMAASGQIAEDGGPARFKDASEKAGSTEVSGQEDGELNQADEELVVGEDGETLSAAAVFCETVKQKADIGAITSESIVRFEELLCLTPRGRFELQMHADFVRLRGKSHDYKILYKSITKLFLLPKPDELHWMFVIALNPPIRQGQTRYPFLVFQFERDDEIELELNLEEEFLQETYGGKLHKSYDGPVYEVVSDVFGGLSGRKVIDSGTFRSSSNQMSIKCSQKANELLLYPLERSFIALPKPTIQILHSEISYITFSRVMGAASSNLRTFEIKVQTLNGNDVLFSNLPREELDSLTQYCRDKKIRVESEMAEEGSGGEYEEDEESDDVRGGSRNRASSGAGAGAEMMDEDSSDDEDFKAGSDSDVAEEFDESYSSASDADEQQPASSSKSSKPKKADKAEKPSVKKAKTDAPSSSKDKGFKSAEMIDSDSD